jgi:hypothetical protein
MVSCKDYAEVISDVDVYVVAEKLDILPLKEVATRKVSTWFEVELQAGLPLSKTSELAQSMSSENMKTSQNRSSASARNICLSLRRTVPWLR